MTYTHDDLSRLDTVTDGNNQTTDYGYDAVGNLQSVALPNGVTAGYGYNAVNRLSTLTHFRAGAPIASYDYRVMATGTGVWCRSKADAPAPTSTTHCGG